MTVLPSTYSDFVGRIVIYTNHHLKPISTDRPHCLSAFPAPCLTAPARGKSLILLYHIFADYS